MRFHCPIPNEHQRHRRGVPDRQLFEEYDAPGLLVATTNVESSLDNALFRRFDEVFQVPLPGLGEIDKLLRMTLSSLVVAEQIDWAGVVERLSGASAAMTVKAAQDAAKAAVLCGEKIVTESLLLNAVSELEHGGDGRDSLLKLETILI